MLSNIAFYSLNLQKLKYTNGIYRLIKWYFKNCKVSRKKNEENKRKGEKK